MMGDSLDGASERCVARRAPCPPNLDLSMQFMQSPAQFGGDGLCVSEPNSSMEGRHNQERWLRTAICRDTRGADTARAPAFASRVVWHRHAPR